MSPYYNKAFMGEAGAPSSDITVPTMNEFISIQEQGKIKCWIRTNNSVKHIPIRTTASRKNDFPLHLDKFDHNFT